MELSIEEVARLLDMPEPTIRRWIQQGKLPAIRVGDEYRVERRNLEIWAERHSIPLRRQQDAGRPECPPEQLSLIHSMRSGGVFFDVPGRDVPSVLAAAVRVAPLPGDVDRDELLELLLERERLASTGIGKGVAIPHPRHPLEEADACGTITTCFLKREIEYNALDGKPVFVLFVMLCPSTRIHLALLSRLSLCLRDDDFVAFLRVCTVAGALFERIEHFEEKLRKQAVEPALVS